MTSRSSRPAILVLVLHLTIAITGIMASAKGVFFPSLIKEFHLSHAEGGMLMSLTVIFGAVLSLVAGWLLVRRVGVQYLLTVPAVLLGLGCIVIAQAQTYAQLLFGFALMSGYGINMVAIPVTVSNWFPERRGFVLGIILAGSTLAGVVFTPAIAYVVERTDFRMGYYVLAATAIGILPPLLLMFVRLNPQRASAATAPEAALPASGLTVHESARTVQFWLILFAYFCYIVHTSAYLVHFVPLLQERGFALTNASLIMSALFMLSAASKLILGYIGDRMQATRPLVAVLIGAAAALLALAFGKGGATLTGFVIVYGLTMSVPMVLIPVLVEDIFGKRYFATNDATIAVSGVTLGAMVGPVAVGRIYDVTGSYDLALTYLSAVPLAGAVALLTVRPLRAAARVVRSPGPNFGEPTDALC